MAETTEPQPASVPARDFSVLLQKLSLKIDMPRRYLSGSTDITIVPQSGNLKTVRLHARQCTVTRVTINGKAAEYTHRDPYRHNQIFSGSSVYQHHLVRHRIDPYLNSAQDEDDELAIQLPRGVQVQSLNTRSPIAQEAALTKSTNKSSIDAIALSEAAGAIGAADGGLNFAPIQVCVEFELKTPRDGLQFVGFERGDSRYPHVFTQQFNRSRPSACLFPCVDDLQIRCPWEVSITCPQTLGDLAKYNRVEAAVSARKSAKGSTTNGNATQTAIHQEDGLKSNLSGLSATESSLQLAVICSGELLEEIDVPGSELLKTTKFSITSAISASQIGFAIGPFEDVDLSDLREIDDDEKLGSNAIRIHGYCLPGRSDEVKNTCLPLAKAIDYFTTAVTPYPFDSYKVCFVDDLAQDTFPTAGLSMCSTRLLFPQNVIDNIYPVTRTLTHALAYQYAGISIVPHERADAWLVVGIAYFITDLFLKQLCGNNEYRWRQKIAADQVVELDVSRPSLYQLGSLLHLDPSESEFLALKSSVILFILDRRIVKSSGSTGLTRIISRIATNAKMGDMEQSALSTGQFQRTCEKMGHLKLDVFFQQWALGAGCPHFNVSQKFNKKKLVIEMLITQAQGEKLNDFQQPSGQDLNANFFMRDVKEDYNEVYAEPLQPAFMGPMTIRIHEADGTPYEHIVEIKDTVTKVEIPYNTKYKRLRRNRRQKDKSATAGNADGGNEGQDDVLLYSLGDVLQSEEEYKEWRLVDWTERDEKLMSEESYEWIRMDADFEWICKMQINMSAWMFVSQLQQDRDVVAQLESLQYINTRQENPLVSTFLIRTLLDSRYFHGIRTKAASCLTKCGTEDLEWIGLFHLERAFQELYCLPNSNIPRSNDFADQQAYFVQTAIVRAVSKIKNKSGRAPMRVKRFFLDKLKFNDNSANEFSDVFYIAALLQCLTDTLIDGKAGAGEQQLPGLTTEEKLFNKEALNEIERYRRIDEWILSFQNTFSIAALACLMQLAQAGIADSDPRDFLQYTRAGNAESLRVQALDCLTKLGLQRRGGLLRYVIYSASSDASPFIRKNFVRMLGQAFATIAIGEEEKPKEEPQPEAPPAAGLVLVTDGEANTNIEKRKADIARRQTIPGAVQILKEELQDDEKLQSALWAATISCVATPQEAYDFVNLCMMLYDPQDSLNLKLYYPRYWRAVHLGRGVVRFKYTSRVRTKPLPVFKPVGNATGSTNMRPPKGPTLQRKPSSTIKLVPPSHTPARQTVTPSPAPSPATPIDHGRLTTPTKRSNILKLSVGSRLASVPAVQNAMNATGTPGALATPTQLSKSPTPTLKGAPSSKRKSSTPDKSHGTPATKKQKYTGATPQPPPSTAANGENEERGTAASPPARPALKLRLSLGGFGNSKGSPDGRSPT